MDFNATIDLIIRDLNEAREIIDDLKKYPGVPVLQIELAKSKCKTAGEVIALLKTPQDIVTQDEKNEKVTGEPVKKEIPLKKSTATLEPHSGNPMADDPGLKPDEIFKPSVIKNRLPDQPVKQTPESTILADKFSHLSESLNEQIGSRKSDEDISDLIKSKTFSSLSEAIGINDRFFFIREIFNDNKDAYSQAITRLEAVESLTDARAVIMSYSGYSNDNEAVKQLLDLVKRKLPSNE